MVSMEKIEAQAPKLVDLAKKAQVAVRQHGLDGQKAKVALVLDWSGSTEPLYAAGTMQKAAERVLAAATQFDDDGDIEVFFFDTKARYAGTLDLTNYQGGVQRLSRGQKGGTDYAPAISEVTAHYFRKSRFGRQRDLKTPVYVAFITDGQTYDEHRALIEAQDSSKYPIFFQAIGLGPERYFDFIQNRLNNHGGPVDNFGFFSHPNIATMSDEDLLDGLLNEFPSWLAAARAAGVLQG